MQKIQIDLKAFSEFKKNLSKSYKSVVTDYHRHKTHTNTSSEASRTAVDWSCQPDSTVSYEKKLCLRCRRRVDCSLQCFIVSAV